jgi:hypothetical protein
MIKTLRLTFFPEENPFEQDKNAGLVWGKINLNVEGPEGRVIQPVIDMVWDVKELVGWILQNETNLYNEEFPEKYIVGGNSSAEYRFMYYELCRSNDEIDDEADSILETYSMHHNVSFGMTGTKTKNIYIGKRNGEFEVSYYDIQENWKHSINLENFINDAGVINRAFII